MSSYDLTQEKKYMGGALLLIQFAMAFDLWWLWYAFTIVICSAFSGMVSQCFERAGEQSKTLYPTDMWEKEASAIETVYS